MAAVRNKLADMDVRLEDMSDADIIIFVSRAVATDALTLHTQRERRRTLDWAPRGGGRGPGCPGHPLRFIYRKYRKNIFVPKIPVAWPAGRCCPKRFTKPRLSWRGSLFVWPEGEMGELSHPPPACPGGTPRAMNESVPKYLGPKIPKAQGFAVALLAKSRRHRASVGGSGAYAIRALSDLCRGVVSRRLGHRDP